MYLSFMSVVTFPDFHDNQSHQKQFSGVGIIKLLRVDKLTTHEVVNFDVFKGGDHSVVFKRGAVADEDRLQKHINTLEINTHDGGVEANKQGGRGIHSKSVNNKTSNSQLRD